MTPIPECTAMSALADEIEEHSGPIMRDLILIKSDRELIVRALRMAEPPVAAMIQKIEQEARRYAEMYPQSSDGRNTFNIFADWVAALTGTLVGKVKVP